MLPLRRFAGRVKTVECRNLIIMSLRNMLATTNLKSYSQERDFRV